MKNGGNRPGAGHPSPKKPVEKITPQPGFQTKFLQCPADILIGGGAAGCGKTLALLLDKFYYAHIYGYDPIIFRREMTDIKMQGGIWDEAMQLYKQVFDNNCSINKSKYSVTIKGGMSLRFAGIAHAKDLPNYAGLQSPDIGFDELQTFNEDMFWFMPSRNRARVKIDVEPRIRATCNPDPESFIARLVDWHIGLDGYPIPERSGVIRFMLRADGETLFYKDFNSCWHKNKSYLRMLSKQYKANGKPIPAEKFIKTFTFIGGTINDNQKLLERNPAYLGSLMAMDENMKFRYLMGNWKVKIDEKSLANYERVAELLTNRVEPGKRYITCDPAGYGKDLMIILIWDGFTVIGCHVWRLTNSLDVYTEIEKARELNYVPISRVCVDADGIGAQTIKLGNYSVKFHGGARATIDPILRTRENYRNLKTQCCYRMAERINNNDVAVRLVKDNCSLDGQREDKIKLKGKLYKFEDLIKMEIRVWKKRDFGDGKKSMIDKDKQIELLGWSPGLGDCVFMREFFELQPNSF